jgi:hypothetical protein
MSSVRPSSREICVSYCAAIKEICQHTNIICVELVHAHQHSDRGGSKCPSGDWAQDGELAFVKIID